MGTGKKCSYHLMFCVAFYFYFIFFCRAFCQTALCSLLRWLHVILRSVLSGNNEESDWAWLHTSQIWKTQDSCKTFFFFFSPGLTSIDHAGLSMPSVALLKSIRVVRLMFSSSETTTTCWGLLASLARFSFTPPLCPKHILMKAI